jgi:MFS family permease
VHFVCAHILARVRRLLLLVSSIVFVDAMLFTALTPLVPHYADQFDLSKVGAGILVGSFGAGALLGGIPGGLAASRYGPKRAVVAGLVLLGLASLSFAAADGVGALSAARFLQGFSSTTTWAGALAWVAVATPRDRRGSVIGTAFGAAVFGAVLGPLFGGIAEAVGIRASFAVVGMVAFAFAFLAGVQLGSPPEGSSSEGVRRAFRDPRFLGGLWLNTLPALLFGTLIVLAPLALDDHGWTTAAIAAVFLVSGLAEAVLNPFLGRASDRIGRLLPIRVGLTASVIVAVALGAASSPGAIAVLLCAAAVTFGSFYTPGMALASHRADVAGLAQGLAFGIMNSAWAVGELVGPVVGGALAETYGDAVPYLVGAALCALTLIASMRIPAAEAGARAA